MKTETDRNVVRSQVLANCAVVLNTFRSRGRPYWNETITEGRLDTLKDYASCGDGWTYVAMCVLGARPWINRKSIHGQWAPGKNMEWMIQEAKRLGVGRPPTAARPGDFLLLDRPKGGHAAILWNGQPGSGDYETWDVNGPQVGVAINRRSQGDFPIFAFALADLDVPETDVVRPNGGGGFEIEFDEPPVGLILVAEPTYPETLGPGAVYAHRGERSWRHVPLK